MNPSPHTPTRSPTPVSSNNVEDSSAAAPSTDIFPTPHAKEPLSPSARPTKPTAPVRAASTPPEIMSDNRIRPMRRGAPGDFPSVTSLPRLWDRRQLCKKRSQYYTEAFATREPNNTPKDRVTRDSVVIADLKISGSLETVPLSFVPDFSFHLAQIYQRPQSSILLTIQGSLVLSFGGSVDPAYLLSITGLASEFAPTKNKRTTGLLQHFLQETLSMPPCRGVVTYVAVLDENLATNGLTAAAEIEEIERAAATNSNANDDRSTLRSISRSQNWRGGGAAARKDIGLFTPSSSSFLDRTTTTNDNKTTTTTTAAAPILSMTTQPPLSSTPGADDTRSKNPGGGQASERKRVRRGKSFLSFFGLK